MAGLFFPTNRRDRGRQLRRPRSVIAKIVQRQFAKLVGIAHARVSKLDNLVRSAVFARRGGGSLRKLLEQLAHLLGRHADAGVRHSQRDPIAAVLLSLTRIDLGAAYSLSRTWRATNGQDWLGPRRLN
jgi:hypothetical protein